VTTGRVLYTADAFRTDGKRFTVIADDTRKRFGCTGNIDIFIECAAENFFVDLAENLDAGRCCVAITPDKLI
jgi:hypothetical protein